MKIFITRPIDEALETAERIKELGFEPIICPLLKIIKLKKISSAQPCLITSKNAIDSIENKDTKLYVLGESTANYARELGYSNVIFMGKDINEVKKNLPLNEKLVYLSGADVTDRLQEFKNITREIVYKAVASDAFKKQLLKFLRVKEKKIILFFSNRTAKQFIKLIDGLIIDFDDIIFLNLSEKIGNLLAEKGFKNIFNAKVPTLDGMLNLIKKVS